MTELRTLKVALLGCGNVGAQVARILLDDAETLASRAGAQGGGVPLCQAVGEFLDPVGSVEARAPRGG